MNRKYFKLAAMVAESKNDKRQFHIGACGIRSDGSIVISSNGPVRLDGELRKSFGPAHSEARLAKKLDVGATVYVVRVSKVDMSWSLARPCQSCQRILRSRGVKKVFYTISDNEYGVMYLNNKPETTHRLGKR